MKPRHHTYTGVVAEESVTERLDGCGATISLDVGCRKKNGPHYGAIVTNIPENMTYADKKKNPAEESK